MDENAKITRAELLEFQRIAKKEYGINLSGEQAFEQAIPLLNLFDHLIKSGLRKKSVEKDRNTLV